jgi:hypothetical protein
MMDRGLTTDAAHLSMKPHSSGTAIWGDIMVTKAFDRNPVSIGEKALWDERLGLFRVKVQGNRNVGSLTILRSADMPISHLDSTLPHKQTKLGQFLRERLELAVNAAIAAGSRDAGSGLTLLTPEETPLD